MVLWPSMDLCASEDVPPNRDVTRKVDFLLNSPHTDSYKAANREIDVICAVSMSDSLARSTVGEQETVKLTSNGFDLEFV